MNLRETLSNIEITLFALYKLGGVFKKIHTEHIAWEAYNLAPERFSWRLPEYRSKGFPDKTPVRYALEKANESQNGILIEGRAGGDVGGVDSEGWTFTPKGVDWIKGNESRIATALQQNVVELHPREVKRFVAKIKTENAYRCFSKDGDLRNVTPYMFTDFLGCTPDASSQIIRKKFERLVSMARSVEDNSIIQFLSNCEHTFTRLMEN